MRKLRILALMPEQVVLPEDTTGHDVATADWKMEFDVVTTLSDLGHDVQPLGVGDELHVIRKAIDELKPHIVFNLLEDFHGVPIFEQNVVAYLELLRVPYTGCNPRGLLLARDKALTKKVLAYHRIPVPGFTVFQTGRTVRPPDGEVPDSRCVGWNLSGFGGGRRGEAERTCEIHPRERRNRCDRGALH